MIIWLSTWLLIINDWLRTQWLTIKSTILFLNRWLIPILHFKNQLMMKSIPNQWIVNNKQWLKWNDWLFWMINSIKTLAALDCDNNIICKTPISLNFYCEKILPQETGDQTCPGEKIIFGKLTKLIEITRTECNLYSDWKWKVFF